MIGKTKLPPHLGDVYLGTFSSRHNHRLKVVVFRQGFLSRGASLVSGIVENAVHLVLKCLPKSVPGGGLQLIVMSFLDDLCAEEEAQFSMKHQSLFYSPSLILTPTLLLLMLIKFKVQEKFLFSFAQSSLSPLLHPAWPS